MKTTRFVCLLVFAFGCTIPHLYSQKLYGCVYELNSGQKIVAGVTIKPARGNAITSGSDGHFTLLFPEMRPGMPVQMSASKPGWIVVNPSDLDAVLPIESISYLHSITMRREADANRDDAAVTKVLNKFMAKVDKRLAERDQNARPPEELILQQKQRAAEQAKAMNSVNQDLVSDSERIAYQLVLKDSIEKAKQLREQMQSEKNFEPAQDAALAGDSRNLEIHRRNLVEQSRLALLEFAFDKADSTLAFLAQQDSLEFKSVYGYASFLQQQMHYEKAIEFYKKAATVAHTVFERIQTWNNLGELLRLTNAYQPAEQMLQLALDSSKMLADSNMATSEAYLAITLNNLGRLYKSKEEYTAAEKAFKTALNIRYKQVAENPDSFTPQLAATLLNLGALYNDNNNYESAEKCYGQALNIYEKLAAKTPDIYDRQIATLHNNLGLTETEQKNFGTAESHFKAALSISRRLAATTPQVYNSDVAETLTNMGDLYRKNKEYDQAEQAYQTALQMRKEIAQNNTAISATRGLVAVQFRLGLLRMEEKEEKGATAFLQDALQAQMQLIPNNPITLYGPMLADIEYTLGELYRQQKQDTAAERVYHHALDIRKQLVDSLHGDNDLQVATTLWSLGALYEGQKNYSSAQSNFQEAYEIYKRRSRDTLESYTDDAKYNSFTTAGRLATILYNQGRYDVAIKTQQDAVATAQQLSQKQPGQYDGNIASLQTNLGRSYFKKGDYPMAQQAYWAAATGFQKLKINKPAIYGYSFCLAVAYLGDLNAEYKSPAANQPIYQKMLAEALELAPTLTDTRLQEQLKKLQKALEQGNGQ